MLTIYEAVFEPQAGCFCATFPDLAIATQGSDLREAVAMAYDAMTNVCLAMLDSGMTLPEPTFGHAVPEGGHVIAISTDIDPDGPSERTVTAQEAADTLGVTKERIYAMLDSGILEGKKIQGRWHVFLESVKRRAASPKSSGRPRGTVNRELPVGV